MAWFYLFLAGLFEVAWAVGLKYTDSWSRLWPSVGTVTGMAFSILFLTLALRAIPLGTAYAVWTGIGAAGTAGMGIWLFAESANPMRLAGIGLIALGIIVLKITR